MLFSSQRNSAEQQKLEQQQQPSSQSVSTASQTVNSLFCHSSTATVTSSSSGAFAFGSSAAVTVSQGVGLRASSSGELGAGGGAGQAKEGLNDTGGFGQTATITCTPSPNETIGFYQSSFYGASAGGEAFGATLRPFSAAPAGEGMLGGNEGGFGLGFQYGVRSIGLCGGPLGGLVAGPLGGPLDGPLEGPQAQNKKIPAVDSKARDPCTWLFLVNGGQQTFDEELKVRENFEKLYKVFVSNGVVKAENVVCATGTSGIMCGVDNTIVNVCSIGKILAGTYVRTYV